VDGICGTGAGAAAMVVLGDVSALISVFVKSIISVSPVRSSVFAGSVPVVFPELTVLVPVVPGVSFGDIAAPSFAKGVGSVVHPSPGCPGRFLPSCPVHRSGCGLRPVEPLAETSLSCAIHSDCAVRLATHWWGRDQAPEPAFSCAFFESCGRFHACEAGACEVCAGSGDLERKRWAV